MSIWSTEAPVPVVFLHGWATSTQATWVEPGWFELVKEGGRRPLGYDLLGHGDADKPDDVDAYRDLVTPVIEQLPFGPDEGRQIDLVGYSLGARTALDLTLRHPGLVRRLVLSGIGRNVIEGSALGEGSDRAGADYRFEGLLRTAGPEAAEVLQKVGEAQAARHDRYFTPEQLKQLKERRPRRNIYVPLPERGRSRALHTFPADKLAPSKDKAEAVKIPRP